MRYTLLTFLCAATIIAYLQRSALGVPSKQIEADLGLTAQDLGLVQPQPTACLSGSVGTHPK